MCSVTLMAQYTRYDGAGLPISVTEKQALNKNIVAGIPCQRYVFYSSDAAGSVRQWQLNPQTATISGGNTTATGVLTSITQNNNLNGGAYSPTHYTTDASGQLSYYNGATWVATGHGAAGANHSGGYGNDLYLQQGNNKLLYYNGTGNPSTILTLSNAVYAVPDIAVDAAGRAWIATGTVGSTMTNLRVINRNGVEVENYGLSANFNTTGAYGLAIIGDTLYVGFAASASGGNVLVPITVSNCGTATPGTAIAFNTGTTVPNDLSSCPGNLSSPCADLIITKTGPPTATTCGTYVYNFTVTNIGAAATSGNIIVSDLLPQGTIFQSGSGAGWTFQYATSNNRVICTYSGTANPPLQPGSSLSFSITVLPTLALTMRNTANVSHAGGESNTSNNTSAQVQTIVTAGNPSATGADYIITKSAPDTVCSNDPFDYTFTITNIGGADPNAVITVIDTIPSGVGYSFGTGAGWIFATSISNSTLVTTHVGPMAAGQTLTYTVTVNPGGVGTVYNRAHLDDCGEVNTANNHSNRVKTVIINCTSGGGGGGGGGGTTALCNRDRLFVINSLGDIYPYTLVNGTITPSTTPTPITQAHGIGLAIATNLSAPVGMTTPTFYSENTNAGLIIEGWTGTAFLSTNHFYPQGTTVNLGASVAGLYNFDNTAHTLSYYTGTFQPQIINSNLNFNNACADVAVDANNNAWLMLESGTNTTQANEFRTYNSSGQLVNTYTLTQPMPLFNSYGLVIVGDTLYVGYGPSAPSPFANTLVAMAFSGNLISPILPPMPFNLGSTEGKDLASCTAGIPAPPPPYPDYVVTKEVSTPTVLAGNSFSYNIIVNNFGTDEGTNFSVTDSLPIGVEYTSATGVGWTFNYDAATHILTANYAGTLAINGSVDFTIQVQSDSAGTYLNTVDVSGGTEITTVNNTSNTVSITVICHPLSVSAGNNFTATEGGNTTFNTTVTGNTAPYTYLWNGPNGFTATTASFNIPNIALTDAGLYGVTITDRYGCTAISSVEVTVLPPPIVVIANGGPYCPNSTVTLAASGGASYAWSGPNGFSSTTQNPTLPNGVAGTYTVTVTVSNGTTASASTTVVIWPSPIVNASNDSPVCPDSPIQLLASVNDTTGITYAWSGGLGNALPSNVADPVIDSAQTTDNGIYTVTVTDANGCTATANTDVTITALPIVAAWIGAVGETYDTTFIQTPLVISAGATEADVVYNWSPNIWLQNPNISTTNVVPDSVGTRTYIVTAMRGGCSVQDTVYLLVLPSQYNLTNAFTPNGDGSNDGFFPLLNGASRVIKFKVFDRWGAVVYEGSTPWDGTYKGQDCPRDVYVYLAEVFVPDTGVTRLLYGDVTLIR